MSSKRKRLCISLETKYKVIQLLDNNIPNNVILDKFKNEMRDSYNISKIKKNREKIIEEYESSTTTKAKSLKKSYYPDIENGLLKFISESNSHGMPVNTLLLKEKASQIAIKHNYNDFKASNGFIDRFKSRNAIIFRTFHGEADGVPDIVCNDWINTKLPELVKSYKPEDIFNGDEFGLFYRIPPNKSFTIKGQKFKTGKKSKERISVFICSNMTGTEKLKPIAIGRAKQPRCFRGKQSLPIIYRNNTTSWMTTEIFTEFLQSLNRKMLKESRNIALILDNCPSHVSLPLSNVKLIFLPPNTTSRLQAMDMGVIHSLKCIYRLKLVRKLLALLETTVEPTVKDIDLYEALIMLINAWNEVSEVTIKNCFIKSGLKLPENETNELQSEESYDYSVWYELNQRMGLNDMDFDDFVTFDNDIAVNDELNITKNNCYSSGQLTTEVDINSTSEEENESVESEEPLKLIDAINAINQLRKYVIQCSGLEKNQEIITNLENEIYNNRYKNLKQTKITRFLSDN
jgi:hypothetical protein